VLIEEAIGFQGDCFSFVDVVYGNFFQVDFVLCFAPYLVLTGDRQGGGSRGANRLVRLFLPCLQDLEARSRTHLVFYDFEFT